MGGSGLYQMEGLQDSQNMLSKHRSVRLQTR
jgi:hypothetical protein